MRVRQWEVETMTDELGDAFGPVSATPGARDA
jgi:hypothetical protein